MFIIAPVTGLRLIIGCGILYSGSLNLKTVSLPSFKMEAEGIEP